SGLGQSRKLALEAGESPTRRRSNSRYKLFAMPSLAPPWNVRRTSSTEPLPLILGAMNFGKRTPESDALRIVDRAIERGVTLIDTANAYVDGESERIVGRALRGRRDRVLVATKVGLVRVGGDVSGL